ncbi:hypothetical protein JTE90_013198 [Oedothorax gibbosus]|uniref:mannose-6-phosphate isomerase n=1 Tax=Oedothorax gibbosus TaxID=931172 RepID=A0AAV6UJ48_9ARAC|nr:hypothetical protein JTE90_013198 [Oedothorax gibbosus]
MSYVFKLRPSIKNYEWGKLGLQSTVALLSKSEGFQVDEKSPYAELWIGTHSSGPAVIPSLEDTKLIDWISTHPDSLGKNISNSFGNTSGLPFLFKVLSIRKPLSIQAHPDKETAKVLFEKFPGNYPDDNHKPEMAIALTEFEALCGFRPKSEIESFLREIPLLKELVGTKTAEDFMHNLSDLKPLFTALMTLPQNKFQPILSQIVEGFKEDHLNQELCQSVRELFLKTHTQYPGDIGCFCLFFLNYLKLEPGDAIFLAANEPHAYLSGDCVECMATSDNVVRAGLTPKLRDVTTLCDILTYNCRTSEENKFQPVADPNDPFCRIYDPPVKEFAVDSISLEHRDDPYSLRVIESASVLLVVKGSAKYTYGNETGDFGVGSILFIGSGCKVDVSRSHGVLMFRAYCNANCT